MSSLTIPSITPAKSKVLIVDDQALMRNHMNRLLKGEGYELHFAEDGLQAVEQVNKILPDLILLDVRLPGIDGFEVCQRVRANPETVDIPIIMVTAFDDRTARLRGIEAGADDFIPKPYDTLELQARVRTITRLNRYRRISNEKAKFELVAELSENGYLLVNSDGKILFVNHQARVFLQVMADNQPVIGQSFTKIASRSYQLSTRDAWTSWPKKTDNHQIRYLLRPETDNLPVLWLQVDTLQNLISDGEMAWVISIRDVTNQIISRQDMWKFQRAIHHKMRTPLIGMYSGIQFLASYAGDMPIEDVKALLNTALDHSERLRKSVEDVLRYVDTPNLAQGHRQFPIRQLTELVQQVAASLQLEQVKVTIDNTATDLFCTITTESMELILRELLENTRKFHPEHAPKVDISLTVKPQSNQVVLIIGDNGTNISPEQIKRIWSPYYQAEKNFTGEIDGMGLGLSTVASVVWSVGGQCDMRNKVDSAGVEVVLHIPTKAPLTELV